MEDYNMQVGAVVQSPEEELSPEQAGADHQEKRFKLVSVMLTLTNSSRRRSRSRAVAGGSGITITS